MSETGEAQAADLISTGQSQSVMTTHGLAERLGVSARALDRLIRRHRRELQSYGPLAHVPPVGGRAEEMPTFLLSADQTALLTLLSETALGVAARARLLTMEAMMLEGVETTNSLPIFNMPDQVRRWAAGLRRGEELGRQGGLRDAAHVHRHR